MYNFYTTRWLNIEIKTLQFFQQQKTYEKLSL